MNTLRIGINFGNVLLAWRDAGGAPAGIAADLARELAQRLGVVPDFVTYESAGQMADGAKAGEWEVAFLAADPDRAEEIVFTAPYLEVGTTYLVWSDSSILNLSDVDHEGIRISVSNKSAYDLFLTRSLKQATLLRAPTPGASVHLFFADKLEALAGLRPFLLDVAAKHSGTRVIDGSFMTVPQAIGVPKARSASAQMLDDFVKEMKASGLIAEIIEKNGVYGATVAR